MSTAIPPSNGKTLLITGINGYIASNLGHLVLCQGYSLRGTTRRPASAKPLLDGAYAKYQSRVKIYEVPDITAAGAFDEAVSGVHGIFHTASPIDFTKTRFEDFVTPAVEGTKTLLQAALEKAGPQLSSVIVTSSVRAIMGETTIPGRVYTEADFPLDSLEKCEADNAAGQKSPVGSLYGAAKMAAEKAVWTFKDKEKPLFALTTILPSVVIGPPIQPPESSDQLNETLRPIWNLFSSASSDGPIPPPLGSGSYVDVRDVATLHLVAFSHSSIANGQRYIASAGPMPPQAVADILRCEYPLRSEIPIGKPGAGYVGYENFETGNHGDCVWGVSAMEGAASLDSSKAHELLSRVHVGWDWRNLRESVIGTARVMERYS